MKLSHWDWDFNAKPCNYEIKKFKASGWSFVLLYSLTQSVGRWTFGIPRGSSVHHNIHHFVRLKTLDSRFGIPIAYFHCSTISQCLTAYCWEMSRVLHTGCGLLCITFRCPHDKYDDACHTIHKWCLVTHTTKGALRASPHWNKSALFP